MEDDRLCHRVGDCERAVEDAMLWMDALPEYAWHRLASAVGPDDTAESVRHACCRSGHIQGGYMWRMAWSQMHRPPWSFFSEPDPDVALAQLRAPGGADHPQLAQLLALDTLLGASTATLHDAHQLGRQVHFATVGVEQMHGISAAIRLQHRRLGPNVMQCHTFISLVSQLVGAPAATAADRTELQLQSQIARLQRKRPQRGNSIS
eukprot:6486160-Pyramimonas_sp.AAC.1